MNYQIEEKSLPPGTIAHHRTGSSYTCDPPVLNTDIDYLVLVPQLNDALSWLESDGWLLCTGEDGEYEEDEGYSTVWYALRKGDYNLMVTADHSWYTQAVEATKVCKARNVLDKADRVAIFCFMRDGIDEEACVAALKRWPA